MKKYAEVEARKNKCICGKYNDNDVWHSYSFFHFYAWTHTLVVPARPTTTKNSRNLWPFCGVTGWERGGWEKKGKEQQQRCAKWMKYRLCFLLACYQNDIKTNHLCHVPGQPHHPSPPTTNDSIKTSAENEKLFVSVVSRCVSILFCFFFYSHMLSPLRFPSSPRALRDVSFYAPFFISQFSFNFFFFIFSFVVAFASVLWNITSVWIRYLRPLGHSYNHFFFCVVLRLLLNTYTLHIY